MSRPAGFTTAGRRIAGQGFEINFSRWHIVSEKFFSVEINHSTIVTAQLNHSIHSARFTGLHVDDFPKVGGDVLVVLVVTERQHCAFIAIAITQFPCTGHP